MPQQQDEVRTTRTDDRLLNSRVVFFLNDRLGVVLDRLKQQGSDGETEGFFAEAELLEAFLWLHLGVHVGYFSTQSSRRAVYEYFPFFLSAYDAVFEARLLETRFASPLRAIFESEFSGKQELFSSAPIWIDSSAPEFVVDSFQDNLVVANEFGRGLESHAFLRAIVVSSEEAWAARVKQRLLSAAVDKAEPWFLAGYFEVVQYLKWTRDFFNRARLDEKAQTRLFGDFVRRVKEIQQWKLNFGNTQYRDRFDGIGRVAARAVVAEVTDTDQELTVIRFLKEVEALTNEWGAPKQMAAGS